MIVSGIAILLVLGYSLRWSQLGLYSSILNTLIVIVSASITIALWEPISGLIGGEFGSQIALLGTFALLLQGLGMTLDAILPKDVIIAPHLEKPLAGLAALPAGIIIAGMLVIGIGFGRPTLLVNDGYGRDSNNQSKVGKINPLIIPFDMITSNWLSANSVSWFHPDFLGEPLRKQNPELYKQASLIRDSFKTGPNFAQLTMSAKGVTIEKAIGFNQSKVFDQALEGVAGSDITDFLNDGTRRIGIRAIFKNAARDFGKQLRLSSSQIRLIEKTKDTRAPRVEHPIAWRQKTKENGSPFFLFNSTSNYITSVSGQQQAEVILFFDVPLNFEPNFLQVKNTRFQITQFEMADTPSQLTAALFQQSSSSAPTGDGRGDITPLIESTNRIPILKISKNQRPAGLIINDEGEVISANLRDTDPRAGTGNLNIQNLAAESGEAVLILDVTRGKKGQLKEFRKEAGANDFQVRLLDNQGQSYGPCGYAVYTGKESVTMRIVSVGLIDRLGDIIQPTSSQQMFLFFKVPEGTQIKSFAVGPKLVGTLNITAKARLKRK